MTNTETLAKYWWSDDEEIIRSEAFDTREQAFSDAYCSRAQCFDDPSHNDSFYLHHGHMVDNPDFDDDAHKHYGFDESNFQYIFKGKTEKIDALTVTDFFHDQWVKLSALEQTGEWNTYDEYHEDQGFVLWHLLPVCEPPYVGNDLCSDWPDHYCGNEHKLRWTTLPQPPKLEK